MATDQSWPDEHLLVVNAVERYLEALLKGRPTFLLQRAHLGLVAGPPTRDEAPNLSTLEDEFVAVAAHYSCSAAISRAAWIEFGVPVHLLDEAGIA